MIVLLPVLFGSPTSIWSRLLRSACGYGFAWEPSEEEQETALPTADAAPGSKTAKPVVALPTPERPGALVPARALVVEV